jgi:hypothetical protein
MKNSQQDIQAEALRIATFAEFDIYGQSSEQYERAPKIGEKITNVCSPFGISSKELFYNLTFRGIVANYISDYVGILDLSGGDGLLSVEGSPIQSESGHVCGIRLPNLHNKQFATSFSFFMPIYHILDDQ